MCLKELDEDALVIINVRVMLWHERSALGDMGGVVGRCYILFLCSTLSFCVQVFSWHFFFRCLLEFGCGTFVSDAM